MNVLHVVPTYYPATRFGGPIRSLLGMCDALAVRPGLTLRVLTTDSTGWRRGDAQRPARNPMRFAAGYDVHYCRKTWGKEFSVSLLGRLPSMIRWADVVHLTGVYSFPTLPVLALGRLLRTPVVWSPRGALQQCDAASRPALKRVWNLLAARTASRRRVALHCTSAEEASASRMHFPRLETLLIPNGIEPPPPATTRTWMPDGILRILYLGRLHPKKCIECAIEALPLLRRPAVLHVCGSGDSDYEALLRARVGRLSLDHAVRFHGHVDGASREERFRDADICVLPSATENFGMVVLEALARSIPVVASTGTPWAELPRRGCGRWVDNDPASLAAAIDELAAADLAAMGARGAAWARAEFAWDRLAERMHHDYERLAGDARGSLGASRSAGRP